MNSSVSPLAKVGGLILDCTGDGVTVCVLMKRQEGWGVCVRRFNQHTDTETVHELHIPEEGYYRQES